MKQYLIFLQEADLRKIYKLNQEKTWYLLPDNATGFQVAEVEKYAHAFQTANSIEVINAMLNLAVHQKKYGKGDSGDCKCPKCGFWYSFNYYDDNDGFYTSAIIQDFTQKVDCICGCKFEAKIKVEVSFETKILDPASPK